MIFPTTKKKVNTEPSLTADEHLIDRVSKFKYPGVIIDELLSWKETYKLTIDKNCKRSWDSA